jgi:magnesium-transporting ATPase (P-type)
LVLINAGFSFWREYRAEQAMIALRRLLPTYARLIREGVEVKVPAGEVVPGDVLVLAEGDNIPADGRVVEEFGLRTNNATLTGEAIPARKSADASLREGISELERPNLVFAGTSVVSGTAKAVVYASGELTQFGRIARLTQAIEEAPSPIQRELSRLSRIISWVAIGLGGMVFLTATFDDSLKRILEEEGIRTIGLAVGIVAAAVPEGLPATITLSLAMAAQRLAQRGVLVKKLSMTEMLGTVSVICTDKSGTLTQNQMTVRELWTGGQRLRVSGVGYEPSGKITSSSSAPLPERELHALLTAAMSCNNARLNPPSSEHPRWTSLGDQTEAALRVLSLKGGLKEERLNRDYPRIHEIPFDARRKRMSTIHELRDGKLQGEGGTMREQFSGSLLRSSPYREIAFVKGAPREILQLCTHILLEDEVQLLEEKQRADILAANDDFSRRALRVLALARRELPLRSGEYTPEKIERELTFLGLAAMMDPPREEVAEAVKVFRQAGIRMVMITGDYGLTAESLARRVGMLGDSSPLILTGAELDEKDDIELRTLLDKEVIFARMAPEHKLRLVAAFQARGEVVAVIGDGVNDAPALRKADVGIAMGVSGTDVAREAADIVLIHDNFAAIVHAIEEGRAVYDNLRKFVTYIFSSNIPEILPFILTAMFKIPLALHVPQILAIDLGTDLFPALALGTERPEINVMRRPPRRRNQPLLDSGLLARAFLWLGMIEAIFCYLGYFFVYSTVGGVDFFRFTTQDWQRLPEILAGLDPRTYAMAITLFLAGVVVMQIGNVFACRTEKTHVRHQGWTSNRTLLGGIAIEVVIVLLLVYFPPLRDGMGHVFLPYWYWAALAVLGFGLYMLEWIRKAVVRQLDIWKSANGR